MINYELVIIGNGYILNLIVYYCYKYSINHINYWKLYIYTYNISEDIYEWYWIRYENSDWIKY